MALNLYQNPVIMKTSPEGQIKSPVCWFFTYSLLGIEIHQSAKRGIWKEKLWPAFVK